MSGRIDPNRPGADGFDQAQEIGDSRIRLRRAADLLAGKRAILGGDQRILCAVKKCRVGAVNSRYFTACHGMAAQKHDAFGKTFFGCGANGALGAAGVGNQRMARHVTSDFRQPLDGQTDRQRDVNEVRARQRLRQIRLGLIYNTQLERALQDVWFIPAHDANAGKCLTRGQGKRSANQSGAEHGDAAYGRRHTPRGERDHHAAILRPTAGAIMRNCAISSSSCSKWSDCAPSESACSGSLCTSSSKPSAPAATAARAMGTTLSRRPVPCEGSASMGKWESFLMTGMAAISRVLRV